jgi:hypothetical protein
LEKTDIQAFINEQKKYYNKDFSAYDEQILAAEVIRKYVDAMKNNIG